MSDLLDETAVLDTTAVVTVPCVYCREAIEVKAFVYWSTARRVQSATCPTCRRRVTMLAASVHRGDRVR